MTVGVNSSAYKDLKTGGSVTNKNPKTSIVQPNPFIVLFEYIYFS